MILGMIEVCDIVEYGNEFFTKKPERWRVTQHLKRIEDKTFEHDESNDSVINSIITDILWKELKREIKRRKKLKLPCKRRYRLVYCRPEEATHIELVNLCGTIVPIKECKKVGIVNWSEEMIEITKKEALTMIEIGKNGFPIWEWE